MQYLLRTIQIAKQGPHLKRKERQPDYSNLAAISDGPVDLVETRRKMEQASYNFKSSHRARLSDAIYKKKKKMYAEATVILQSLKDEEALVKFRPKDQITLAICLRHLCRFDEALQECKSVWKTCRSKADKLIVLKTRKTIYSGRGDFELALNAKVDCLILEISELRATIHEIEREADALVKYGIEIPTNQTKAFTPQGNPIANRLYEGKIRKLESMLERTTLKQELIKPLGALAKSKSNICKTKIFEQAFTKIISATRFNEANIAF